MLKAVGHADYKPETPPSAFAIRHAFKTALSKILRNFTTTLKKSMIFGLAGLVSKCFRINYRHMDRNLSNEEVNEF